MSEQAAPIPSDVLREASCKAEERFAKHYPEQAAKIERVLGMYRFDSEVDRHRAHEVARIVSGSPAALTESTAAPPEAGSLEMRLREVLAWGQLFPPASVLDDSFLEGWCDGQTYWIENMRAHFPELTTPTTGGASNEQ